MLIYLYIEPNKFRGAIHNNNQILPGVEPEAITKDEEECES
jgi:hypothetical protein